MDICIKNLKEFVSIFFGLKMIGGGLEIISDLIFFTGFHPLQLIILIPGICFLAAGIFSNDSVGYEERRMRGLVSRLSKLPQEELYNDCKQFE